MKGEILYSNHAVKQMFSRNISPKEVEDVLQNGEIIMDYPDDKPFASKLLYCIVNTRPLHVVCSYDADSAATIVITAYEPNKDIWENDYKTRKK
jgi:hypothetical protein